MSGRNKWRSYALKVMEDGYWQAWGDGTAGIAEMLDSALEALGAAGFALMGPEITEEMEESVSGVGSLPLTNGVYHRMAEAGDLSRKLPTRGEPRDDIDAAPIYPL